MASLPPRFHFTRVPEVLTALRRTHDLGEPEGQVLLARPRGDDAWLEVRLPLLADPVAWLGDPDLSPAVFPESLGRQLVVLIQAGACSLGLWDGDELVAHKVLKRYVVRGRGRAQPTHLKTKGKSRYGARLRLQNARRLLDETGEKLAEWVDEFGPLHAVYRSCPVRTWPAYKDVFAPHLPERVVRVPWHVHVPDHAELLRVRALLERGRLEVVDAPPEGDPSPTP